ncbi:MAG: hypothetical protein WDN46_14575 [Methylocella sp.]
MTMFNVTVIIPTEHRFPIKANSLEEAQELAYAQANTLFDSAPNAGDGWAFGAYISEIHSAPTEGEPVLLWSAEEAHKAHQLKAA